MSAILLIDGRSGSGKTELAQAIVADNPAVRLIRFDELYPGWGGLEAGSRHVLEHVLEPLAAGEPARWQRWDWATNMPAEWHDVDPARPLVIEGCGALSAANRALASHGVWVELDAGTRKRRALDRDGELYAPHWDEWAAQEDVFIARENPAALADEIVDGHNVVDGLEQWRTALDPARVAP